MKRQLVAEQWDEFEAKVLESDCSVVQRTEMRRAFYAGAQSILFRVVAAFTPDDEPTEADVAILQDVHDELQEFGRSVRDGLA